MKRTTLFLILISGLALAVSGPVRAFAMSLEQVSGQLQPAPRQTQTVSVRFQDERTAAAPVCKVSGTTEYGDSLCERRLEDGTLIRSESHQEQAWNESKKQTLISVFDPSGALADKQMVRHKTEYRKGSGRRILKESVDIVRYPAEGKITREVLIFRYDKSGKRIVKLNDARYVQIKETGFAELIQNTSLTYGKTGSPLRGRAELWKDGKPSRELFRWNKTQDGLQALDIQAWKQWEARAKSAAAVETLLV